MSHCVQDLRYAVRALRRRPLFTAAILFTLALGIGANTAIFSLVRGVVVKPLSYPEPDRLVHLYENHPRGQRFKWGEDPIGRRLTADMTSYFPKLTIVGVVADNHMHGLERQPFPLLHWPMAQYPSSNAWLLVRTSGSPEALARAVTGVVHAIDPDVAVANVTTMDAVLNASVWRPRFAASLLGVFAVVALLLAAAGIYAVMSYSVSRRTPEVGLRVSLGATPATIVRLVVGHGAALGAGGVALGCAGAVMLRSALASQVFGVSPSDPVTLLAVCVVLLVVAVTAAAVPARRAMRLDPVTALRST